MSHSPLIRRASLGLSLLLAAAFASCEDEPVDASTLDGQVDITVQETIVQVDVVVFDTSILDVPDDLAPVDTPESEPVEGGFGWPCDDNDDCNSGYCTEGLSGQQCTRTCVDQCPEGFACKLAPGVGGDPISVCLYEHIPYCRPCDTDADCSHPIISGTDFRCLTAGPDEGAFCATSCDGGGVCPDGAVCQTTQVDDSGSTRQLCVPAGGAECTCSPSAVADGASTWCNVANAIGTCGGRRVCTSEGLGDCDAPTAVAESCNGVDDDCNGVVDDGFETEGQPCDGDDEDMCADGVWFCSGGGELSCTDDDASVVEVCNDLDDDCDGATDETFVDGSAATFTDVDGTANLVLGSPCGVGACAGGTVVCGVDGVSLRCSTDGLASAETCDGTDNDCDGEVDEDTTLTNDLAALAAAGCLTMGVCGLQDVTTATCTDGAYHCSYSHKAWEADEATCDNLDNDCDDTIDEDLLIGNDSDALMAVGCKVDGVCALFGATTATCQTGQWRCDYLHPAFEAEEASCDQLDNDCDGDVDEDLVITDLGQLEALGCKIAGVCGQPGVTTGICSGGGVFCDYYGSDYGDEVCDGKDNDCNGSVDDGLSEDRDGDLHYAIGSCASPADDCDDRDPDVHPGHAEVCDGLDNDCNGSTDPIDDTTDCATFFTDVDDDTYGRSPSRCMCAPSGDFTATVSGDCYDGNALARPSQTNYYAAHRGDGSFDYDCNGRADKNPTQTAYGVAGDCKFFNDVCTANSGWKDSIPGCGVSRQYLRGCQWSWSAFGCRFSNTGSETMRCR